MKKSAIGVLRRWMALDQELWKGDLHTGLVLTKFAADWDVHLETIRRDLAAFKELGFEAFVDLGEWKYARDQQPMFAATKERYGGEKPA